MVLIHYNYVYILNHELPYQFVNSLPPLPSNLGIDPNHLSKYSPIFSFLFFCVQEMKRQDVFTCVLSWQGLRFP
jgi:hypothetical protein